MMASEPLQIGELCRRLDVPYRDVRYVLERGFLPDGAEADPGHGHYRRLTAGQATWLAIILKLKASGVRVPQAALVADFARDAVRTVGQQMGLDPDSAPFEGKPGTNRRWFIDFGDMRYIRLVIVACPARGDTSEYDWETLEEPHQPDPLAAPVVILRVDLTRIAQLLIT
jgi:hypothetical protein